MVCGQQTLQRNCSGLHQCRQFLAGRNKRCFRSGLVRLCILKNRSVLSILICPNTHAKTLSVCVLGQINVLNTCTSVFTVH